MREGSRTTFECANFYDLRKPAQRHFRRAAFHFTLGLSLPRPVIMKVNFFTASLLRAICRAVGRDAVLTISLNAPIPEDGERIAVFGRAEAAVDSSHPTGDCTL